MKHLLTLLLIFSCIAVAAQKNFKLNEHSVVKDSSTGFVFPAQVWQPFVQKGSHALLPENANDPNTAFYLVKVSEKENETRWAKMPKPRESMFFRTGRKEVLPNVKDIYGNDLNLKDMTGKIIVMNFWFINCRPCRMEIPELNEVVAHFAGNDKVIFLAVGLDQKDDIKKFIGEMPFNYTHVDNGRFLTSKFGVQSFPTHAILDQQGKVYFHTTGLAQNTVYWVKRSIEELLTGEKRTAAK